MRRLGRTLADSLDELRAIDRAAATPAPEPPLLAPSHQPLNKCSTSLHQLEGSTGSRRPSL